MNSTRLVSHFLSWSLTGHLIPAEVISVKNSKSYHGHVFPKKSSPNPTLLDIKESCLWSKKKQKFYERDNFSWCVMTTATRKYDRNVDDYLVATGPIKCQYKFLSDINIYFFCIIAGQPAGHFRDASAVSRWLHNQIEKPNPHFVRIRFLLR
jgi:hypothetical protein